MLLIVVAIIIYWISTDKFLNARVFIYNLSQEDWISTDKFLNQLGGDTEDLDPEDWISTDKFLNEKHNKDVSYTLEIEYQLISF